jgi:hypothetical protein
VHGAKGRGGERTRRWWSFERWCPVAMILGEEGTVHLGLNGPPKSFVLSTVHPCNQSVIDS